MVPDIFVGVAAVPVFLMATGFTADIIASYFGGIVDTIVMVLLMAFLPSFPGMVLALIMVSIPGRGMAQVMLALAIVDWLSYARVARSAEEYVEAAAGLDYALSLYRAVTLLPQSCLMSR